MGRYGGEGSLPSLGGLRELELRETSYSAGPWQVRRLPRLLDLHRPATTGPILPLPRRSVKAAIKVERVEYFGLAACGLA